MDYIIVQAGGKGTRLGYLTKNKPKALAPVENLPMLFHLFRKYPDKRYVIIADYKKEVMRKYLSAFSEVRYQVVDAEGSGTCSGIRQALNLLPDDKSFMLIWSDLILPPDFSLPDDYSDGKEAAVSDYVGLSSTFPCRWKYENGAFSEERSTEYGVAGFFLFRNRAVLNHVPESGEFVRFLQQEELPFSTVSLAGTREFGILDEYRKLVPDKTRPFNRISIEGDVLTKEPVDPQGDSLATREAAWYEKAKEYGFSGIPKIFETKPLKMEYIHGVNIYECDCGYTKKREILSRLVQTLKELHGCHQVPYDSFSMKEAYYSKTIKRLARIAAMLPFAGEQTIRINGRTCRNVFFHLDLFERRLEQIRPMPFTLIHGDCTFSNLMLRDSGEPVLIDPRGYFGYTELYGDERYDWAKLYYSLVGNYDRFNLKKFMLDVRGCSIVNGNPLEDLREGDVKLSIESNGWESLEKDFFTLTGADEFEIRLLHAVIWLSLTTYVWQDYDSILGAFYNGLYYLEEVL